ncbi:MAG: GNAT family N-acetyltransferase [Thermoplasmata archaeon]
MNQFNPRSVYDHVADISVYVARERPGEGIGGALLKEIEDRARGMGYHKLVLTAFPYNLRGRKLYGSCGFREVGIYREQGLIDGKWVDVLLMELLL